MSASMCLDPSRGFVALPLDVLEIEMSPGAFRTLVELCRMADSDGVCWASLEQIGTRLSRSRAAISGYVAELHELALIETESEGRQRLQLPPALPRHLLARLEGAFPPPLLGAQH